MRYDPPGENPQDTVYTVVVYDATIRLQRGPVRDNEQKAAGSRWISGTPPLHKAPGRRGGRITLAKGENAGNGAVHVARRVGRRPPWPCVRSVSAMSRRGKESWGPTGRGADSAAPGLLTKHAPQATTQTTTPISGSVKLGCLQRRQQTALIRWRRVLDPGWRPDTSRSCVFDRQPVSSVDSPNRRTPARLSAETRVPVARSDG